MNLRIAIDIGHDSPGQQRRAVMTSVGIHERMLCRAKPSGVLSVKLVSVGADGPVAHVVGALVDWLGVEHVVAWSYAYRDAKRGEEPCVYVTVEGE